MGWRRNELLHFGDGVAWLSEPDAAGAYRVATSLTSRTRYGLDSERVNDIEKLNVDEDAPEHATWLASRLGPGDAMLLVIYEPDAACRVRADFFVKHWRDLFLPSRDDVIILPESGDWVLYYSHEDEFEFGCRPESSGAHPNVSADL